MKIAKMKDEIEGLPYYLVRELAMLKSSKHPNIIELTMVNLAASQLRIFMPFVENTLSDLLHPTGGSIPHLSQDFETRRSILYQILNGINYCHERGVLHRNLVGNF